MSIAMPPSSRDGGCGLSFTRLDFRRPLSARWHVCCIERSARVACGTVACLLVYPRHVQTICYSPQTRCTQSGASRAARRYPRAAAPCGACTPYRTPPRTRRTGASGRWNAARVAPDAACDTASTQRQPALFAACVVRETGGTPRTCCASTVCATSARAASAQARGQRGLVCFCRSLSDGDGEPGLTARLAACAFLAAAPVAAAGIGPKGSSVSMRT